MVINLLLPVFKYILFFLFFRLLKNNDFCNTQILYVPKINYLKLKLCRKTSFKQINFLVFCKYKFYGAEYNNFS